MKKTIYLLCLICIAFLVFSSCDLGSDTVDDDTTDTFDILQSALETLPLEPNKTDLPSYSELCKIQMGMTKGEVVSIIGYPQRKEVRLMPVAPDRSSVCSRLCYIYDSSDGPSILVAFSLKEGTHEESVANLETVNYSDLNGGDENTTTDSITSTTEENIPPDPIAEYFDYDYLHKPTNESVKSITRGMTMPEVIEIIGKPHSPGPLSGMFSLQWKTEEGYTCMITCAFPEDALDDIPDNMHAIEAMMKYGAVVNINLWEENPFGT